MDNGKSSFNRWKDGPSATESEKADNAVRLVTAALRDYDPLRSRSMRVFAQGSYRNRTNVRQDSDVDVCVLCSDTFHYSLAHAPGTTRESLGIRPASYDWAEYKEDIEAALVAKFGRNGVGRGDKAFDVHENSYRIAADVVPAFEWRDYIADGRGGHTIRKGTVLRAEKSGQLINNYPEQHYASGVSKHDQTARQFKKKTRILKRLRHHLIANGVDVGKTTSSFLIESLVFNSGNGCFTQPSHYEDVRHVLADVWRRMESEPDVLEMMEVNGIKYLFHADQPWTVEDARKVVQSMWSHIDY